MMGNRFARLRFAFFFVLTSPLFAQGVTVYSLAETTRIPRYENITFYLRMPRGWSEASVPYSSSKEISVRGVLAVCSHRVDPDIVAGNVKANGPFRHLVRFADRHKLALVTWTNFKGYVTGTSGDEMDRKEYAEYDRNFNQRVREWENGYSRLATRYGLPRENIMIYGISGGAQMAHRLVLRRPNYFSAVHVHVNSSYDVPSRDANSVLWLVTTGTREYGYPAGERFYRQALEQGYHMIFRAEENLGHRDSPATRNLSLKFFEYALRFIPDPTNPEWKAPPENAFYFMRYPTYVGDYFNQIVFPVNKAEANIERQWMVPLPTKDIARAWGMIIE